MKSNINLLIDCLFSCCLLPLILKFWGEYLVVEETILRICMMIGAILTTTLFLTRVIQTTKKYLKEK